MVCKHNMGRYTMGSEEHAAPEMGTIWFVVMRCSEPYTSVIIEVPLPANTCARAVLYRSYR